MLLLIPDLPEGMSDEALLKFYDTLASNLQEQSSLHMHWFTHTRNPSVCWICDLNILIQKVMDITEQFITKSSVDLETASLSENEADSESEYDMNHDDEPVPEYETE